MMNQVKTQQNNLLFISTLKIIRLIYVSDKASRHNKLYNYNRNQTNNKINLKKILYQNNCPLKVNLVSFLNIIIQKNNLYTDLVMEKN